MTRTSDFLALCIALAPIPFLQYFPNNPLIGRLAIPLLEKVDGSMQTIFWIDFLVLAFVVFLTPIVFRKKN